MESSTSLHTKLSPMYLASDTLIGGNENTIGLYNNELFSNGITLIAVFHIGPNLQYYIGFIVSDCLMCIRA